MVFLRSAFASAQGSRLMCILHVMEEKLEVVLLIPQERSQQRTVEGDCGKSGVIKVIPQERVPVRIVEQSVDVTVSHVIKEIAELVAEVQVPQIQEHVVEVFKVFRQERVSECVVEQILAVPQIQEHVVEVFKVIPQEQVSKRIVEWTVAVPQIQELAVVVVFKLTPPTRSQSEEMQHRDLEVLVNGPQENGGSASFDRWDGPWSGQTKEHKILLPR